MENIRNYNNISNIWNMLSKASAQDGYRAKENIKDDP